MTDLEELVKEISRYEAIVSEWDETQRGVVVGLKRAIESLHKEALTRLIKSVKQESMTALRDAVKDEVVYGVLLYHELVKPLKLPLEKRVQAALDMVRPNLESHSGDVELVTIKPPDTVEIRFKGACSNCQVSSFTLSQLIQQSIKEYCPEVINVISVS
jgi:Fe-S cluster biogenesis protein NfuA